MFQFILSIAFLTRGKINLNNKPFTLKSQLIGIKPAINCNVRVFQWILNLISYRRTQKRNTFDISRENKRNELFCQCQVFGYEENALQNRQQFSDFIKKLIRELKNAVNQFNNYVTILLVCLFNKSLLF